MIVDTSVLIALLREEPESGSFVPMLSRHFGVSKVSTANYFEAAIVIDANRDQVLSDTLDAAIAHFAIELISVSQFHAVLARKAYRQYGKGNHRARLNFGDCFAYALAKATGEPLLFKGDDFIHTDIVSALAA